MAAGACFRVVEGGEMDVSIFILGLEVGGSGGDVVPAFVLFNGHLMFCSVRFEYEDR
jgi:hypothetical protein